MITFEHATKRYGANVAVDDLTFQVAPGRVTALLGPNGAGKSTAIRLLLGLDRPTGGRVLVAGRPYQEHRQPLRLIGAQLDGRAVHPGRSARQHLLALARAGGLPERRADECLDLVGLGAVRRRRTGAFSLGMGQRLGIAAALLGDPQVLVLDEPVNGLDVDGIRWVRELLRGLAERGRTVLLSSHLLAEVEQTADHVVVLGRGRLLADCPVRDLRGDVHEQVVLLTPDPDARTGLVAALPGTTISLDPDDPARLVITGSSLQQVGDTAHELGLRVHGLLGHRPTLEEAYRGLVGDQLDHAAGGPGPVDRHRAA